MKDDSESTNTKTKHLVQIGEPVNRAIEAPQRMDAFALLWACAKAPEFIPATIVSTNHPVMNDSFREMSLPDPAKFLTLRERIGYWEATLDHDDPEILLGAAVNAALNTYFDLIIGNALAADPVQFITTVTQAALEWAEECFSTTTDR